MTDKLKSGERFNVECTELGSIGSVWWRHGYGKIHPAINVSRGEDDGSWVITLTAELPKSKGAETVVVDVPPDDNKWTRGCEAFFNMNHEATNSASA